MVVVILVSLYKLVLIALFVFFVLFCVCWLEQMFVENLPKEMNE